MKKLTCTRLGEGNTSASRSEVLSLFGEQHNIAGTTLTQTQCAYQFDTCWAYDAPKYRSKELSMRKRQTKGRPDDHLVSSKRRHC